MASRDRRESRRPSAALACGRRFLDEDGRGDELRRRAQAADREVLDRARGLDAVVGVGRDRAARRADRVRCGMSCRLSSGSGSRLSRISAGSCGLLSRELSALYCSACCHAFLRQRGRAHHPDLDRSAARRPRGDEARARRPSRPARGRRRRSTIIAAEHRPGRRRARAPICQDTGMPTFEVHVPVGANQICDAAADPRGGGRGDPARQAAAELGRFDHRRELRRQPRAGHADHPLRSVGARRHRGEADPQGRRLREHQRAVLAADRAAAPRPRRPHRSTASASASCTRSGTRRARAAAPAPSASASAAIARPATCTPRSSCSARSTTSTRIRGWRRSKRRSWRRSTASASGRWASAASVTLIGCKIGALNRLPASFFVSVAYDCWAFRRLGVRARRRDRRDHASGCTAIRRRRRSRWSTPRPAAGVRADRPRDRAAARRSTRRRSAR